MSSTIGIAQLKKPGGVKGAQKLFLIFSFRCWTCATLHPSLGDSPRLVTLLPSLSSQTLKNAGQLGGALLRVLTGRGVLSSPLSP